MMYVLENQANIMQQQKQSVHYVTIDESSVEQRVDNFLMKHLKNIPKSRIYRIIRKGEVRVNKGRVKASDHLKEGDVVRIPPIYMDETTATEPEASVRNDASLRLRALIKAAIIYEDEKIIVINKPAGLAVHGSGERYFGVLEIMRQARPDLYYLELVHRLDRDTSGCLVLAKKRSALRQLHQVWRDGKANKYYWLLVQGKVEKETQRVDKPLKKYWLPSGEHRVRVDKDGRAALTVFTRKKIVGSHSFLEAKLLTGRTHQLRVHAASTGHPIIGDERYAGVDVNQIWRQKGVKRLCLHACQLSFVLGDKSYRFDAPWVELSSYLEKLR